MSYRNIFVETPAKLSTRNEQLVVTAGEEHKIPIEDISCLLIESQQTTVTAAALAKLAQDGVGVFVCDNKHLPCACMLPMAQHTRELKWLNLQAMQTKPKNKQLWQQVVKAKIINQSECLRYCELKGHEELREMAARVTSGDSGNMEGAAAAYYFRRLFGRGFGREYGGIINASLNYGYAILRGAMARSIVVYGFHPAVGLHHCSELNNYNLADDCMEPFRPVVDLFTALELDDTLPELNRDVKHSLFNLLNVEIFSGEEKHSVSYAMERMVQSLGRCLEQGEKQLSLPRLLPLAQHIYD